METTLNWKAFEFYDVVFFYMYPALLHMNPKKRVVSQHPPNWKLIPWFLTQIVGISFLCFLTWLIILRETFYPTSRFSAMQLTIFIALGSAMLLILGWSIIPLVVPEHIPICNQVFQWGKKLELDFYQTFNQIREEDSKKVDLIGLMLCSTTCLMSLSPFPIMLICALVNMDQINYIFEEFLPEPMQREAMDHIFIPLLIRLAIGSPLMFEGTRTMINSFNMLATYVHAVTHGLRILGKIRRPEEFIPRYRQIQLLSMLNSGAAGFMGALLNGVGQAATTALLWMTINRYELAPTLLMYVMFPVVAFVVICFTIIMFEQSVAIFELSNMLVVESWRIGCVERAFEFYDIVFFYMYPALLHMNPKKRVVSQHPLNWKLIPWFLTQIVGISLICFLTWLAILRETFYPTSQFSAIQLTIYIALGSAMLLILGWSSVPLAIPEYIPICNQIFHWEQKLELDFPQQWIQIRDEDSKKVDLIGLMLCSTTCLMSLSPFPVIFFCFLFNMDPIHYVLEEILPEPMQREAVDHILIPLLIRLAIISPLLFEGFRTLINSFNLLATYVHAVTHGLRILGKIRRSEEFIPRYRQIQLLSMLNSGAAGFLGALLIGVGQAATTALLWMTINGYELAPTLLMYAMFPGVTFVVICFTIVMFEQSVSMFELSNELVVKYWRIGCVERVIGNGKPELLFDWGIMRVAKSLKPFSMTLGPIRPIKRGFEMEYLDLLMNNLTNALLLIDI
ncbi:unnamed protein product [Orchesella dallaii]|uniref:Uncharacterized protein n=1 Tax=Orchesella dallaii TaxID=48710 RepID=A0ABP1S7L0_9HEXA